MNDFSLLKKGTSASKTNNSRREDVVPVKTLYQFIRKHAVIRAVNTRLHIELIKKLDIEMIHSTLLLFSLKCLPPEDNIQQLKLK